MIVGFMRVGKRPSRLAKLTAMLCEAQGLKLLYMRPINIDMERNIVKGLLFENNRWTEVETEIPLLIDINPPCFRKRYQDVSNYLRKNSYFTYDSKGALNKHLLLEELKKDDKFSHLVIPTTEAKNFKVVLDFLEKYKEIVLKPINSDRGRGVYKLVKNGSAYTLSYLTKDREFNREELESYFDEYIKNRNYISQKYISSQTKQGDPFDCRIHVQKNGKGKWIVARNYIRIGIGQKIISNINQGGGISDLVPFLKANFGDNWEEINKKVNELARTLPYKIERLKGTPTMSLGFDVAINQDGQLYLFESNGAPAVKPVLAETSMLRVRYYNYLINNKLDKKKIKQINRKHSNILTKQVDYKKYKMILNRTKKFENQIKTLEKERDDYKKANNKIKESTSWKFSAPIRFIGNLKKKSRLKK